MAAPERLSAEHVDRALDALPGWTREGDELCCEYQLPSFVDAVQFTNRVADVAELLVHHPEWTVRYRRVALRTTTHDAGGLTRLDVDLATRIAAIALELGAEVL